jgi:hypothetical protein
MAQPARRVMNVIPEKVIFVSLLSPKGQNMPVLLAFPFMPQVCFSAFFERVSLFFLGPAASQLSSKGKMGGAGCSAIMAARPRVL